MNKEVKRLSDRVKELEAKLADAERRSGDQLALYRKAVETSRDGIALFDPDFRLVFCNQRYKELLQPIAHLLTPGRPIDDLIRHSAISGVIPEATRDPETWIRERREFLTTVFDEPFFFEVVDGTWLRACDYRTSDGGMLAIRTDVTDMKKREAELQDANSDIRRMLEAFFEHSPMAMLVKDSRRRYRAVNKAFERMCGVDAEQVIGRRLEDTLPDTAAIVGFDADRNILDGDDPVALEHKYIATDGREGTVFTTKFPIHDSHGDISAIGAIIMDTTQFTHVQQQLADNARLLETTLRSIDQGFAVFDKDLRIITCNQRFFDLHNYPVEERRDGLTLRDMLTYFAKIGSFGENSPEEEVQRRLAMLSAPDRPEREERRQSDGRILDVRRTGLPDGGYVATFTDITEQKRAEHALRISEENFRNLVENSEIGISIGRNAEFLFVNDAFARTFGYDNREDILKLGHYRYLLAPHEQERVLGYSRARVEGKPVPTVYEFEGVMQDGSAVWIQRTARLVNWNGEQVTLGTVADVTQRHKAEERLRAALNSAESANRAKSEFLAKMSHELRTPLNAIIGFSEVLGRETFGPLGHPRYNSYVEDIAVSGRHLLEMINDILDMSKIESGGYEISPVESDLKALIAETIQVVRGQIEQQNLDFRQSVDPSIPALYADRRAVRQILLNLLSNAIKFTPPHGKIGIDARLNEQGGISLSVTDSGIGIEADDLDDVLQPFNQGSNAHQTVQPGTGLGLPIVKSLIELHGGRLIIESKRGTGTIVTVEFPKRSKTAAGRAQAS
jgi:two-component system cell cycle sensor histidine kinase PleC